VGAEVMAGDVIGTYGKSLGFSLDQAKYFTSFTLVSMLVGYIIAIITIPRYISQETSLKYAALLGVVFTIAAFLTKGQNSVTFIALLGLANAPMWPAIFPLGIKGLGNLTKIGSAIMVMGIAGGAVVPLIYGILSKSIGFQAAFMVTMLPCYLYVLYFSIWGHKAKSIVQA
jgi:fucose permease